MVVLAPPHQSPIGDDDDGVGKTMVLVGGGRGSSQV